MKVYFDMFSDKEVLSDTFPITEMEILFDVKATKVHKDDCDDETEMEFDLVQNHNLVKYEGDCALDKKLFMGICKRYMVQMKKLLEDKPERFEVFKKEAETFIKRIIGDFGNFDFYHPQIDYDIMEKKVDAMREEAVAAGKDPESILAPQEMPIVVEYVVGGPARLPSLQNGIDPHFYFFKDGLRMEKF